MIMQANIKYVVYNEEYRDTKGVKFLQQMNVATLRWMDLMVAKENGLLD